MGTRSAAILLIIVTIIMAGGLSAAAASPPPPSPPAPGGSARNPYGVQVGPKDSLGFARKMKGKINVIAVLPTSAKPSSVEILVDGSSIGRCSVAPYRVEFDTQKVADGQRVIKAVGRDQAGKEIWAASSRVEVVNTRKPTEGARTGTPTRPGLSGTSSKTRPDRPDRTDRSSKAPKPSKSTKGKKPADRSTGALPAGLSLDNTYSSEDHGVSISYPGVWTFKDQTATMERKSKSDFWLVFGAYPIEKATLVVNVRRTKIENGSTAERFATYNPYVKTWESKTVLDSPAFATTSRVLRPKPAVIHRLIIIKDSCAWMINCTDYVGKTPEASLALLNAIVATITSPAPGQ